MALILTNDGVDGDAWLLYMVYVKFKVNIYILTNMNTLLHI